MTVRSDVLDTIVRVSKYYNGDEKGRRYGDEKRSATYSDICAGDKVLLKQVKNDKGSTTFAKDPFVVISRNGNSVVIENKKGRFKRNITHVKKFNYVESNDNIANQSDFARKSNDVLPKVREKRKTQVPKRFADDV